MESKEPIVILVKDEFNLSNTEYPTFFFFKKEEFHLKLPDMKERIEQLFHVHSKTPRNFFLMNQEVFFLKVLIK
jgi:hypothetical protein